MARKSGHHDDDRAHAPAQNIGAALISTALFAVVGASALSAFGFQGRVNTVGIDLGTTFSVVAVKRNGTTTVIPNLHNKNTTPSVVSFLPDGGNVVGEDALPYLELDPQATIYNAKRFIGRRSGDPVVSMDAALYPFEIFSGKDPEPKTGELPLVQFVVPSNSGENRIRHVSPEAVGAAIVSSLRLSVEVFLGHNQAKNAVIAVPADFGATQKKATRRAFALAGFNVVRVIDEPTAAAVAYGLHNDPNVHHVLVFDLGGGTLDTSLLHVNKGSVQVILEDGDNHLGGEDFDQRMLQLLKRCLTTDAESKGIMPPEDFLSLHTTARSDSDAAVEGTGNMCSHAVLKRLSEAAKRALSHMRQTTISCTLRPLDAQAAQPHLLSATVTRSMFEEECSDLYDRALRPVESVLENAYMKASDVDEVVMVGGSSRMPRIRELVSDYFGGMHLRTQIDPDLAVAIGAASIID